MIPGNQNDVMDASQLLEELKKLMEKEKAENDPTMKDKLVMLQDAIDKVEMFSEGEGNEPDQKSVNPMESIMPKPDGVVDTSVLTGPIGGLKNFLMKTQRDNESK